uniref:C2H2-type domain-containing protein n=1 Tax=Mandrillus leucophaeus TaxID=9568 RepID=A0A2K5YK38_MANLE
MTMGDVKTPDFDDPLAAFDIPDMADPKAAIENGHDDHESHMKQNAHREDDSHTPSFSNVDVSMIFKNVRNVDSSEGGRKTVTTTSNGRHNGFLTASSLYSYGKDGAKSLKEDMPASQVTLKDATFSQFSPISSAEEFDDDEKMEVDEPPDKEDVRSSFRPNLKALGGENSSKTGLSTSGNIEKNKIVKREAKANSINPSVYEPFKVRKAEDKLKENSDKVLENRVLAGKPSSEKKDTGLHGISSSKLSSCIAAIAALSAKKAASDSCKEPVANSRESSPLPKEVNDSPRAANKSPESQNLIDGTKTPSPKPPNSPRSISRENSSKGSPSSPAGSTPAIPKVRIKTIKTSSAVIKRTVTRVLPEVDLDSRKKPSEQTASVMASVTSLLSSPASAAILSSLPKAPPQSVVITNAVSPVTIKPVATTFLPVSSVKTTGSQVINLKLTNNTMVKATLISAASVQSAISAIIKANNAIQQQIVVVPASSLANAKLLPKIVHLANLNLLPQGAQATSELCLVLTKPQQQIKQVIINAATSKTPPQKMSQVQVVSSLQNSVVEAFNKVPSSVNPVPVYIPNLSPPANAGIMLPMHGCKCLECGDSCSPALWETKSLTQSCDRWIVCIKVTCNHCTKNLIFYNKCSLLSYARGHKEKGVVMQCSHLILKPVPADQMTVSPSSNTSTSTSTLQSPVGASTHTVAKIQSGITGTVILAPSSTPIIAAMPLDEDPSKLLKRLECNEVFPDETSLATHFQQAADTSGQKTCTICQMLLPNQCSYASHRRIHQHKSPYTCPECRAISRSVHFQTHVTKNCLHYTRSVGFRCVHCNVVYSDGAALKSHIQGSRCEVFDKCPICPMAFKSAPSTHSHTYTQHPGIKIEEPKIIWKCSMCDTVLTLQTLLYHHFDQHIENQKVSVFKCPDCSLLYAQRQLMMDHIKSAHGTLKSIEGPPNLGINLPLSIKPATQNSANQNKEDTKSMYGKEKLEKKSPSPVKKNQWKPRKCPGLGGRIGSVTACSCREMSEIKEDTEVPRPKRKLEEPVLEFRPPRGAITQPLKKLKINVLQVHRCVVCGFTTENLLQFHEHIPQHKSDGSSYQCRECGLYYTSHVSLSRHLFIVHRLKEPQPGPSKMGLGTITNRRTNPKCKVCTKTFETEAYFLDSSIQKDELSRETATDAP